MDDSDSFEEKKVYDWVDKIEPRLAPDWLDEFKWKNFDFW